MGLAATRAFAGELLTDFGGGRDRGRGEVVVGFVESAGFCEVGFEGEVGKGETEGWGG